MVLLCQIIHYFQINNKFFELVANQGIFISDENVWNFVSGNKYIGQMSDSKLITICVKDGNNNMNVDFINEIITAWPNN